MEVIYQAEPGLSAAESIDVLVRSTLAERRPVDQPYRIAQMLTHADLVLTARVDGLLVGVSRALSDFAFCTYLADLAVDAAYQKLGATRVPRKPRRNSVATILDWPNQSPTADVDGMSPRVLPIGVELL